MGRSLVMCRCARRCRQVSPGRARTAVTTQEVRLPTPSSSGRPEVVGGVDVAAQRRCRRRVRARRRRPPRCASLERKPNRGSKVAEVGRRVERGPDPGGVGDEGGTVRRHGGQDRRKLLGAERGRSAQTAAGRRSGRGGPARRLPGQRRVEVVGARRRGWRRRPSPASQPASATSSVTTRTRATTGRVEQGADRVDGEGADQLAATSSPSDASRDLARDQPLHRHHHAVAVREVPDAGKARRSSDRSCQPGARERRTSTPSALRTHEGGGGDVAKPRSMRERRGWAFTSASRSLKPLLLLFTRHDWVDGDEAPRRGRRRRRRQPRLARRPADVRAPGLRPRPAAALPRQGRAVRRASSSAGRSRCDGPDPGAPDDRGRVAGLLRRRRGGPGGAARHRLPRGDADPAPRAVADGRARPVPRASRCAPGCRSSRSPSGGRRRSSTPTPRGRGCCRRKTVHAKVGDPVDLDDLRGPESPPRSCARRPSGSWTPSRACSRTSVARRRRRSASTRGSRGPSDREPAPARRPDSDHEEEAPMSKVAVFGAGSWGTAFSLVLADAGHDVTMWGRREDVCAAINEKHENPDYLPGIDASRRRPRHPRPRRGRRRRRAGGAGRAVADAAREPRGLGRARCLRTRC